MLLKTKFCFHPNPKIYALLTLLILIASNMQSCKKDILMPNTKQLPNSIESVRSAFIKGNYQKELSSNFMDTIHISWIPNWKESRSRPVNDTLSYLYIPLDGKLITAKHPQERKMVTVNTEKYIVAAITNDQINFKLATYTSTNTKTEEESSKTNEHKKFVNHSIQFSKFEGKAIIKNLKNNITNYYTYASGISNKNKLSSTKHNGPEKLSAYREVCSYYLTCLWINNFPMYCGDVSYGETQNIVYDVNSIDQCYTPPGGYWNDGYTSCVPDWTFGGSYITQGDCYYWPEPDPVPTDPGNGDNGTEGNTATEYNPLSYKILSDPAIDLQKLFNCFNTVPDNGATYSVTLNADLPVNDDPLKLVTYQTMPPSPGHAFITITKTNGNNSVSQSFGFYPSPDILSLTTGPVGSKLNDNGGHDYDACMTMLNLTEAEFQLVQTKALAQKNSSYDINNYNCTNYALDIFNIIRDADHQIEINDWIGTSGFNYGQTPNGLYNKLLTMKENGYTNITKGEKKAPEKKGECN